MRRMMHKFRFGLVAEWVANKYQPCRVADVGGGKGLLAHLLIDRGFEAVVIDPVEQNLKYKYRDIKTGKRVKLSKDEQMGVPRVNDKFRGEMAKDFDLLVGLHAHGSNMAIIQAAADYGCDWAILPCCVIDEPVVKRGGVNWLDSLVEYGQSLGFEVKKEKLNFTGQDVIIYND